MTDEVLVIKRTDLPNVLRAADFATASAPTFPGTPPPHPRPYGSRSSFPFKLP